MISPTSGTDRWPCTSITLIRRRPRETSRRAGGVWMKKPAAAPAPVLTNALRVSMAAPRLRRQRREIRRRRQNVVVGEVSDRFLHQLRVDAVSRAVLEEIQLARDVDRMKSGDPRNVAEAFQRVAVADIAGDRPARRAALDQRLSLCDAPLGDIGGEARMRI